MPDEKKHIKTKKKKLTFRAKSLLTASIILICAFGVVSVVNIFNNQQTSSELIPRRTPGKNGVATPDGDVKKYGAPLKHLTFTTDERDKLKQIGYTDDEISRMTTAELHQDLYGSERYMQECYMETLVSPYGGAKEPSDSKRAQILTEMTDLYKKQDYSGIVHNTQSYLSQYTFENYKDEPITSLYHDALSKLPSMNAQERGQEDDTEKNDSVEYEDDTLANNRQAVEESLGNHYSAIAALYDTFNIDATMVVKSISDTASCTPVAPLQSVSDPIIYDMHKFDNSNPYNTLRSASEVPHKDALDPGALLVYEYKCTDTNGQKLTVIIDSVEITKHVVGVYYDNSQGCLAKTALDN